MMNPYIIFVIFAPQTRRLTSFALHTKVLLRQNSVNHKKTAHIVNLWYEAITNQFVIAWHDNIAPHDKQFCPVVQNFESTGSQI